MEAADVVRDERAPLVDRRFWVYGAPVEGELGARRFNTAFDDLQKGFQPGGEGPLGLCVIVGDRAEMAAQPEAVWPDTDLLFAGYTRDDRQVRIRYFWGAKIGPGVPSSPSTDEQRDVDYSLEDRYRIEMLEDSESVSTDDVLAFWKRERAIDEEKALRRVHEVKLVAITGEDEVAGVSTLYMERNAQLRMDLWNYRTFVGDAHRMSSLAAQLIIRNRDMLETRFTSGEDTRAQGMLFDLENEGMQRHLNNAYWPPSDFTFIGENRRGHHRRVHYFPGARVPVPVTESGYH